LEVTVPVGAALVDTRFSSGTARGISMDCGTGAIANFEISEQKEDHATFSSPSRSALNRIIRSPG